MLPDPPRIGSFQLETPLVLAPVSGFTDFAFRVGVRRAGGAALASTDLVNPRGVLRRNLKTNLILATGEADRPLAVQLYGADGGLMAEAAGRLEQEISPAVIDINMGCPVWKVTRKGGGAALLEDPERAARLAGRVAAAVKTPVTAKLRLGPAAGRHTAPELARRLADRGVAGLTVHGRTTGQRYSGPVDAAGLRRVVEAAPGVPVFANGDVTSYESAERLLAATGAAGLAIGRAALRNPWIFSQIAARDRGEAPPAPARAGRIRFMREHFQRLVELKGAPTACRQFRKWARHYAAALEMSRDERSRLLRLAAPEDLEELAGELLSGGRGGRSPK